jgi:hypothetical protein
VLEQPEVSVEVIEHCGGAVSADTGLVDTELIAAGLTRARATRGQLRDAEHAAKERAVACAFLLGSNPIRFGKLLEDFENNYHTQGRDRYPSTLQHAYSLIVH